MKVKSICLAMAVLCLLGSNLNAQCPTINQTVNLAVNATTCSALTELTGFQIKNADTTPCVSCTGGTSQQCGTLAINLTGVPAGAAMCASVQASDTGSADYFYAYDNNDTPGDTSDDSCSGGGTSVDAQANSNQILVVICRDGNGAVTANSIFISVQPCCQFDPVAPPNTVIACPDALPALPDFSGSTDGSVYNAAGGSIGVTALAGATCDIEAATVSVIQNPATVGDCFSGVVTRTYTLEYPCFPSVVRSHTITVPADDDFPVLVVDGGTSDIGPSSLGCVDAPGDLVVPGLSTYSATDDCTLVPDIVLMDSDDFPGIETPAGSCNYVITRLYSAEDECMKVTEIEETFTYSLNGCSSLCCSLDIVCPNSNGGSFQCTTLGGTSAPPEIPAAFLDAVGNDSGAFAILGGTINDACGQLIITAVDADNGGTGCTASPLIITRTFTITDDANNNNVIDGDEAQEVCMILYTVIDDTDPVITSCPSNLVLECDGDYTAEINSWLTGATDGTTFIASDNCDANLVLSHNYTGTIPAVSCTGTTGTTVVFTATDDCGNAVTCSALIIINDTSDPVISGCPSDLIMECDGDYSAEIINWLSNATAAIQAASSDDCDIALTVSHSYTGPVPPLECNASTAIGVTVFFYVEDDCGNIASCSAKLIVTDTSDPVLVCPAAPLILEACDGANGFLVLNWLNSATASDDCDGALIVTNDFTPTSVDICAGTVVVNFETKDACGNISTCMQSIIIADNDDPSFLLCPLDITVNGIENACNPVVNYTEPIAIDDCGIMSVTRTMGPGSGSTFVVGSTTTIEYTATDNCGNTELCTFTITVEDSSVPSVACPLDVVICAPLGSCEWVASGMDPAYSEGCSGAVTIEHSTTGATVIPTTIGSINGTGFDLGTTIVSYVITNTTTMESATCTFTITVEDCEPPNIVCPLNDIDVECDGSGNTAELTAWLATVTAVDDATCSSVTIEHFLQTSIELCGETQLDQYLFVATDAVGNSSSCTASFGTVDTTDPTITTGAANGSAECGADELANFFDWLNDKGGAIATDACSESELIWTNNYDGSPFVKCPVATPKSITFTVTDDCGNTNASTASFTVMDTSDPLIVCPDDITLECEDTNNAAIMANWISSAQGSDGCGNVTYTNDFTSLPLCGSSSDITFTVTDDCGRQATCSASVTITDTQKPIFMVAPVDLFVECDGSADPGGAIATWLSTNGGAMAVDQCDPTVTIAALPGTPISICGNSNVIPYTFTASDDCNNLSVVEVANVYFEDTTPPLIVVSADPGPIECNLADPDTWASTAATANDVCQGSTPVSYSLVGIDETCTGTSVYEYIFYSTDVCGNTAFLTGTYSIVDTGLPIISAPMDLTINCNSDPIVISEWLDSYTSSDLCSNVVVTNNFTTLPNTCGGSVGITWTSTDDCGNVNTDLANLVIAEDVTDPVFVNCPVNMTVGVDVDECTSNVIFSTPIAEDCNGIMSVTQTMGIPSGNTFPLGDTTIVFTATDNCMNTSTCEFVITVIDTDDPQIFCPSNNVVQCADAGGCTWTSDMSVDYTAAIENCPGFTITHEVSGVTVVAAGTAGTVTGTIFNLGISTVTYTIMDANGNPISSCSFIVEIKDCESPTIVCNDALNIECGSEDVATWIAGILATGTDVGNCSTITTTAVLYESISSCGNTIEETYLFTVTDAAGNSSTCLGTYESDDTTAPVMDVSAQPMLVECNGSSNSSTLLAWLSTNGGASASDACGDVTWSNNYGGANVLSDGCGETGIVTVTFTATNACGLSTPTMATFTISDTTAPILSCPTDIIVECNDANNIEIINAWLASATVTDACSPVTVGNDYAALPACGSSVDVIFTVAGNCDGTVVTCTRTITVVDTQKPEIMISPYDIYVECDGTTDPGALIATWANTDFGDMLAVDQCDATLSYSSTVGGTTILCGGSTVTEYTFTATDACGNLSISEVAYAYIIDTMDPTITAPVAAIVDCELDSPLVWANTVSATDANGCGSGVTTSYALIDELTTCTSTGWETVRTYLFTGIDDCGNEGTPVTSTYTVQDTEAPMLTPPDDLTVSCGDNVAALISGWITTASATDNCNAVTITNNWDGTLPDLCGDATGVTITWTASDGCLTTTATAEIVASDDITDPVFVNCPLDMIVGVDVDECTSNVIFSTPIAEDCNGILSVVQTSGIGSGMTFPLGPTTIVFTATDNCMNTSTCEFVITVIDTDDPQIFCPSNDVVQCADAGLCTWTGDASINYTVAFENCPGYTITHQVTGVTTVPAGTVGSAVGTIFNKGISIITYTIMDTNGNPTHSCVFNVIVEDCEPATFTCPPTMTVECGPTNANDLAVWLATPLLEMDNCLDLVVNTPILFNTISGCGDTEEYIYMFSVTDCGGNQTTCLSNFIIEDTTIPAIDSEAVDMTVECNGASNSAELLAWLSTNGGAIASDVCGNITWSNNYGGANVLSDDCGATGTVSVVFTAMDECGLVNMTSADFIIEDTTDPVWVSDPINLVLECDGSNDPGGAIAAWLAARGAGLALDDCGSVVYTNDYSAGDANSGGCSIWTGMITVTFTATDECLNTETTTATITINDTTAPTISCPADDNTLTCDDVVPAAHTTVAAFVAAGGMVIDECSDVTEVPLFTIANVDVDNGFTECPDDGIHIITRTYTITDLCGNSSICEQLFIYAEDTSDPIITVPPTDMTVECDNNTGMTNDAALAAWLANFAGAVATDNDDCTVDSDLVWSFLQLSIDDECGTTETHNYRFIVTDLCGNSSFDDASFIIRDITDPVITTEAEDILIECNGANNVDELLNWLNNNGNAIATEECSSMTWSNDYGTIAGSCGATGAVTVTFTVSDACGNTAVTTATLTINDTVKPTWPIEPADITFECTDMGDPLDQIQTWLDAVGFGEASDDCSIITYSNDFSMLSDGCGTTGTAVVTFTATDACGNFETSEATVTVVDNFAPTITSPAKDETVQCDGGGNLTDLAAWLGNIGGATAQDYCGNIIWNDPVLMMTFENCGNTSEAVYMFNANDECGNTSANTIASFIIIDTIPPMFTVEPMDTIVDCDALGNVVALDEWLLSNAGAMAEDVCGGSATIITPIAFTSFEEPTTGGSYTDLGDPAVDHALINNTGEATVDYPGGAELGFGSFYISTGSNGLTDGDFQGISNFTGAVGAYTDGTQGYQFNDTDGIVRLDIDAVDISGCAGMPQLCFDLFVASTGWEGTDIINGYVTYEDATTSTLINTTGIDIDGLGIEGSWMTLCVDLTGHTSAALSLEVMTNSGAESVYIDNVVVDCITIDPAGAITGIGDDDSPGWSYDLISQLDLCSNTAAYVYRFTATDECGNSETREATFSIQDTLPPAIIPGMNLTTECDQSNANNDDELLEWVLNNAGATATDACSDNITWTNNFSVDNWVDGCNDTRFIDVTFYATDDCMNVDSTTHRFGTVDETAPTFTNCPRPDIVENAETDHCDAYVNFSYPEAIDNCGDVVINNLSAINPATGLPYTTGDRYNVGTTILTFEAVDGCDNRDTCQFKVIVNDFWEVPTIVCPPDTIVDNDPWMCGAVIDDLAPMISDDCADNLMAVYQITDAAGNVLETGLEDASGFKFPVGTTNLNYCVQDQPLLLISEITQDADSPDGGMAVPPMPIADGDDYIEITNFGPASYDLSCLVIERVLPGGGTEIFVVPQMTILAPGDVLVLHYGPGVDDAVAPGFLFNLVTGTDLAAGDLANYLVYYGANNIDAMTMDPAAQGGIIREDLYDTDTADDFYLAETCYPITIGMYNPEYPAAPDNGSLTSLQSVEAKQAVCTTIVTVNDVETPYCSEFDFTDYPGTGGPLTGGTCSSFIISVPTSYVIGDINLIGLQINHADFSDLTAYLTSPNGTTINLFDAICPGAQATDFDLDSDSTMMIIDPASCALLGDGEIFQPAESLKEFCGEDALGDWTLTIGDGELPDDGTLIAWSLQIGEIVPYSQMDTIIDNDLGFCGAEFTWIHPELADNCCVGTIEVDYLTEDDINVPNGGIVLDGGTSVTEYFEVGTTTIKYTLTDAAGNMSMCSFDVTVLDVEDPMAICPADIFVALDPGACDVPVNWLEEGTDNCSIDSTYSIPANGSFFPIGTNPVWIFVVDPAGNIDSCMFNVIVNESPTGPTFELACNNDINLSLDQNCEAVITTDMILEGDNYGCYDNYCITIVDAFGNVHDNLFDITDINQTFTVTITDCLGNGNACWGYVTIEEKLIPEIECPEDITVSCNHSTDPSNTGTVEILTCEPNATSYYDDVFEDFGNCSDPRAQITRTWSVTDGENLVTCEQVITIKKFELTDIIFPDHFDFDNALECSDVGEDPTLTDPTHTGWPTIDGVNVTNSGELCMVSHLVADEIYWVCPGAYEILRTWKIRDMCSPVVSGINPIEYIQVIQVLDTQGPIMHTCPDQIVTSVSPWDCLGATELPVPEKIEDECGNVTFEVSIAGPGKITLTGSIEGGDLSIFAENLPKGLRPITYIAKDECGNITTCEFNVLVVDQSSPIPVAYQDLILSLTNDGVGGSSAKLYNYQVDNGSYDGCSNVHVEIRRETDACGIAGNTTFDNSGHPNDASNDPDNGEYVKFCCSDLYDGDGNPYNVDVYPDGTSVEWNTVIVWMRVWDDADNNGNYGTAGDNYNETWVNVRVENKLPPTINCLPDVILACNMDYEDLNMTGEATASSLCGSLCTSFTDVVDVDGCGVGTVFRFWWIDFNCDGIRDAEDFQYFCAAPQVITMTPLAPFDGNINWPRDYTGEPGQNDPLDPSDGCDANLGEPTWNDAVCSLVAAEVVQIDTFDFEEGACYKVLKTWAVIDWCQFDANDCDLNSIVEACDDNMIPGYYMHTQTIKYIDIEKPEFTACDDDMFDVAGDCSNNSVMLFRTATDDGGCSGDTSTWLKWYVTVDLWGDGGVDYEFTSFGSENNNINSDGDGNGILGKHVDATESGNEVKIDLTGILIEGSMFNHVVEWKVTDGCGNVRSCNSTFMVVDKKAPTPYCVDVSTALMQNGMVEMWACDFDKGATDNCTDAENLLFTFDNYTPDLDYITVPHYYNSSSIAIGFPPNIPASYLNGTTRYWDGVNCAGKAFTDCGVQDVQVYVWDEKLNSDFCTVELTVCGSECDCDLMEVRIAGTIATEIGDGVENVEVSLVSEQPEFPKVEMTNSNGEFGFDENLLSLDYEISNEKNDDYMNGVSTLDLLLIQKHILGLQYFDSPYKVIAADVNSSESVSALDLIELRKLILGIYTELPNNGSWRFVDASQTFNDIQTPWPFVESIEYTPLQQESLDNNFIGVKIGDVNQTVVANVDASQSEVRSDNPVNLVIESQDARKNEIVTLDVLAKEFTALNGFQFTMELKDMELIEIQSGTISIKRSEYHVHDNGLISVSWNNSNVQNIEANEVVFKLKVKMKEALSIENAILLTDRKLQNEAYVGTSIDVVSIDLGFRSNETEEDWAFDLMQNEPNPFTTSTRIGFILPTSGYAKMSFVDVSGRVLKVVDGEFSKGLNSIEVTKEQMGISGLIYYTLEFGDITSEKSMIVID